MNFEKECKEIEAVLGYTFRDPALLRQAFTRKSYCNEAGRAEKNRIQSNEVLEFCGDSVLSTAIITVLMEQCSHRTEAGMLTELDEGSFTVIKSNLTNKSMLSCKIAELGLARYLLCGRGDEKCGIKEQPSVMEDLFESIIGAVYFDSGKDLPRVISLVERMLDASEYLKKNAVRQAASPYNALQEFCQGRRIPFSFEELDRFGPEHDPTYVYACMIDGRAVSRGEGKSMAKAKAAAAERALPWLEEHYR